MNMGGSKLWLVMNPANTRALIKIMQDIIGIPCSHLMDSKAFYIHPALLRQWGIKYKLVVQREVDLLVTTVGEWDINKPVCGKLNVSYANSYGLHFS